MGKSSLGGRRATTVQWLNWLFSLLQAVESHMDARSCPGCSTSSSTWKIFLCLSRHHLRCLHFTSECLDLSPGLTPANMHPKRWQVRAPVTHGADPNGAPDSQLWPGSALPVAGICSVNQQIENQSLSPLSLSFKYIKLLFKMDFHVTAPAHVSR